MRLHHKAKAQPRIADEAHFMRSWLRRPLQMGAVLPSSRALGRVMASHVPLDQALAPDAAVLELGPGTGVVTRCLLDRGVPEANLVLLEFSPDFCRLLRARFPQARIVEGDAYAPGERLGEALSGRRVVTVVSSLPLITRPDSQREAAVSGHLARMEARHPFIQFTYSPVLPVRPERVGATVETSAWIKLNLPPARVLVYRRETDRA